MDRSDTTVKKDRILRRPQLKKVEHEGKKIKVEHERTFVLAYPIFFQVSYIGGLVSFFEENGFHLKGMMLMNVSKKFIEKHLRKLGGVHRGESDGNFGGFTWVGYLTSAPVVAMILEGHEAVERIKALVSDTENTFFWTSTSDGSSFDRPTAYCSYSALCAKKDIQTWFGPDRKATKRSHLAHLLSGGQTSGSLDSIYKTIENDPYYQMAGKPRDLHACFLKDPMSFLMIKPKAFDDTPCVGQILSAVEYNSCMVRGLKLVLKSKYPNSIVWSDSSASNKTHGDEYGIAMVVTFLSPNFKLVDTSPNLKHIDLSSKDYVVGSNYVYRSKPDEMWSDIDLFFPDGLTMWTDPKNQYLFGKMFEPTLIGLDPEE